MTRAIVHIACEQTNGSLYALCNDGSLWELNGGWRRIERIPQDLAPGDPGHVLPAVPEAEFDEVEAFRPDPGLPKQVDPMSEQAWPPRGLIGLYEITLDGKEANEITSKEDCLAAVARCAIIVESTSVREALNIYEWRDKLPATMDSRFTLDGTAVDYLHLAIF